MAGSVPNLVRVRVIASEANIKHISEVISEALEKNGVQVLEQSRPYPVDYPDQDKKRVYITGQLRSYATAEKEVRYEDMGEQP